MDRKLAEQIVALVDSQIDQLIASLEPVQRQVSAEDFAAYQRGIARVIAAYEAEIVERIAREYPDLGPSQDDADSTAATDVPPHSARN